MIGYIILGILALIFIYITVLYFVNSKKINKDQKQKKDSEKKSVVIASESKKEPEQKNKVEVNSEMLSATPIEQAINEEKDSNKLKSEFQKVQAEIEKERAIQGNRLYRDKDMFKTSLEGKKTTLEKTISSQTNVIGEEGPSEAQIDETDKEIKEENTKNENNSDSIADEINNISPELKAILMSSDILNKKYWVLSA